MKNYKYMSTMNGITKSIKSIRTVLLFVICLSAQLVKAESKESKPVATYSLSGLVRDAHTKNQLMQYRLKH